MRARYGLTLLEVLTSLMLILALVSLLLPSFARGREMARRTTCLSNLQQISRALQLYAQDAGGRFPAADNEWRPLLPYTRNRAIFECPSEPPSSKERYGASGLRELLPGSPESALPLFSSYCYRGGLASDDYVPEPIARDRAPWHQRHANVLYLTGDVRWVPAAAVPEVSRAPSAAP